MLPGLTKPFPFQIKICGLRDGNEIRRTVAAGADAIGINLVRQSRRFVGPELLHALCTAAEPAMRVGVVANPTVRELERWQADDYFDMVQLHGNEPVDVSDRIHVPYVRAVRLRPGALAELVRELESWLECGRPPSAVLLDAWVERELGGTGAVADWEVAARLVERLRPLPVILAGGLTPENVAEAIRYVQPAGVDVASGVERAPGEKDLRLVEAFVRQATEAFEWLG